MKRILCPTDMSAVANNAIVYAAKMAQVSGSEIILFNVQSLFDLGPKEWLKGNSEEVQKAKSVLEAQAFEVAREFDISCYAELQVSGIALSNLISKVGSEFDLIVMGTNGPDDLYQFFAGSNTYHVIRKATTPVLLAPSTAGYNGINLAILAYDYLRDGIPPIEEVYRTLHHYHCELRVLQLLEESYSQLQEDELKARQGMITDIHSQEIQISFDSVHTGKLTHALDLYMKRNNADLLILNSRHYSMIRRIFHRSITRALSVIADFPVLVIHA